MNEDKIKKAVYDLLVAIGEDPSRDGLIDTPRRVSNMYKELLSQDKINYTTFESTYDDIIIVKDIEFSSMCEHHLLPFFGVVHVAYIPNNKIIGLSKIARVVEKYAKRLQVQERMTEEILQDLRDNLNTDNIAIYVEAKHMCMVARGVRKELSSTVTVKLSGKFKNDRKDDFYSLIR